MRFWRFNAVGVLGFAVQLAVLALLVQLGLHYLAATALAVEAAILHNFLWHERWTWRDRPSTGWARLARLARFHALNGAISLGGNLLIMRVLVGVWGVPPLAANLVAVIVCSAANFVASDRAVFQDAMRAADRSASATKVSVPFVHPPVGSVGEPTTNRLS